MKQFLIGGSVVLAAVALMGSTSNRGTVETTIVRGDMAVPANGYQSKNISCPAGKYATGFGFLLEQAGVDLRKASPSSDGKAYYFFFYNPTTSQIMVIASVICM